MSQERWYWSSELQIPSHRGASHQVLEEIAVRLEEHHWTHREIYGVQLALEEALVNAIKHGNRSDHDKRVRVLCHMSDRRLRIEIADEGAGFDPADVPDPTAPENLEKPSGRGILLMRSYMTRVEYNRAGNMVVMEKDRATPGVRGDAGGHP